MLKTNKTCAENYITVKAFYGYYVNVIPLSSNKAVLCYQGPVSATSVNKQGITSADQVNKNTNN